MGDNTYEFADGILRKVWNPNDITEELSRMSIHDDIRTSNKHYKIQLDSHWKEFDTRNQGYVQTFYDEVWHSNTTYKNLLDTIREYQLFL